MPYKKIRTALKHIGSSLYKHWSKEDLMNSKLSRGDTKILSLIALYRILTVSQLAAITQRSRQVIRRRLRFLSHENLILTRMRGYGRGSGRPEDIISITETAAELLQNEGMFSKSISLIPQKNIDFLAVDHDLLINWFYIHLVQIEQCIPDLAIHPRSPGFLLNNTEKHYNSFKSLIRIETGNNPIEFVPDGIFTICHKGSRKSLLFFLEVDMGTEPKASLDRNPRDIRQKILNYQTLFRTNHYKHYERIFNSKHNGFRLLFLTNTASRSTALCRLIKEMPPSDFIWLTDQESMFTQGVSAKIWTKGGRYDDPPESILGLKMACKAPALALIR